MADKKTGMAYWRCYFVIDDGTGKAKKKHSPSFCMGCVSGILSLYVAERPLPLFVLSSCRAQRLANFAFLSSISQHRLVPRRVSFILRRNTPVCTSLNVPFRFSLLSSSSGQGLANFALFSTISHHQLSMFAVIPISQEKYSSLYVPERPLPLFVISCRSRRFLLLCSC